MPVRSRTPVAGEPNRVVFSLIEVAYTCAYSKYPKSRVTLSCTHSTTNYRCAYANIGPVALYNALGQAFTPEQSE
jgi:hypothetical protein